MFVSIVKLRTLRWHSGPVTVAARLPPATLSQENNKINN